jgi:basic membrane lipoprotein Med (substrate-binding protein (PBP1-ABC) superfamily)
MKKILAMVMTCVMLAGSLRLPDAEPQKRYRNNSTKAEVLKVGVLYISPKDDGGYSQAHAEGIAQLSQHSVTRFRYSNLRT